MAAGEIPAARAVKILSERGVSVPSQKFAYNCDGSRRPWLRCSSVEYSRYSPSSRLARDDDPSPESHTNF